MYSKFGYNCNYIFYESYAYGHGVWVEHMVWQITLWNKLHFSPVAPVAPVAPCNPAILSHLGR